MSAWGAGSQESRGDGERPVVNEFCKTFVKPASPSPNGHSALTHLQNSCWAHPAHIMTSLVQGAASPTSVLDLIAPRLAPSQANL